MSLTFFIGVVNLGRFYKKYLGVFLLPCLVCFLVAFVIPFVYGIVLSFFSWRSSIVNITFVGFDNYVYAITDNKFQYAFLYTALFTIVSVITVNIFAFSIALLLTRGKRFTNGFRTVFFMPNLIGGIILGNIWQVIINAFIKNFFNPYLSIFDKGVYGFWGLVILMNWQLIGYMAIIYIAAIQNISKDLLDASSVDGAGFFTKLRSVIIPSVRPAITICLFLTITNSFKLYDQNLALSNGLPLNSQTEIYESSLLALDIVRTITTTPSRSLFGVAQAKSVIFFIMIGLISITQVFFSRRGEQEA